MIISNKVKVIVSALCVALFVALCIAGYNIVVNTRLGHTSEERENWTLDGFIFIVENYYQDKGRVPYTSEGFQILQADGYIYEKASMRDSWGTKYSYTATNNVVEIRSLGKNKKLDTVGGDDIVRTKLIE